MKWDKGGGVGEVGSREREGALGCGNVIGVVVGSSVGGVFGSVVGGVDKADGDGNRVQHTLLSAQQDAVKKSE